MSQYRLAQRADEHLDEIVEKIAIDDYAAAQRVLAALHRTFSSLSRSPRIGMRRFDVRPNLHVFPAQHPAHNYVVFYEPAPDGIVVLAVLHGRRDWQKLFIRGEI